MKRHYVKVFTLGVILAIAFLVLNATNIYAAVTGTRIAGDNRYATAVKVAVSGWSSGSSSVILATGENYPDALSAATIAKKYNAPIILTTSKTIEPAAYNEIKALGAKTVYIVGGTGAVSESAAKSLTDLGLTVERIAGIDRFDTSVQIANKLGTVNEAFIVTGTDFPDALSVASIAAQKGLPILLVAKDTLPESVKAYLAANNIAKTYVIGDANVISNAVTSQLPNPEMITGNTKYERNVNIINKFAADLDFSKMYIATGENFPDALAGSALAAKNTAPIILVAATPGTATKELFNQHAAKISACNILGGSGVVSRDTLSALGINDPTPQAAVSGAFITPKFADTFTLYMDSHSEGYFTGHMMPDMEEADYVITIYDQKMKRIGMSTKYQYANHVFHDGLIAVKEAGTNGLPDTTELGKILKALVKDHSLTYLEAGKYGYIDPTGKEIIPDDYYGVSDFKNGLAIVHTFDGEKVMTLVINKQNQVQFQEEGSFFGEIGDNYIYLGDNYREPGYDKNGSFYDYQWNRISMASRKGTSDEYGYWAANGDRINIPGYKSEMDAFSAKFGNLYEKTEYLGKGFFKVTDVPDNAKTGFVDRDNHIIVPMGNYSDTKIVDTETSKLFAVYKNDSSDLVLYAGTGKVVLGEGTATSFMYMGGGGVYYAKMDNIGWGAVTVDGKTIVAYSSKLLTTLNYNNQMVQSADAYALSSRPKSNFVFYSTANMNEKADTTELKALVAQAQTYLKKRYTARLATAIANANSIIASANPKWIDISMIEIELYDARNEASWAGQN